MAGLDIGSRTVKLAVLDDGRIGRTEVRYNTYDPLQVCRELLAGEAVDRVVATGSYNFV